MWPQVPKTEKPGSCSRATRHLEGEVAVETKYDGERCVWLTNACSRRPSD